MYVDDYLDSLDGIEEARNQRKLLTETLALGGFKITKWQSNFPEVLLDNDNDVENDLTSVQQEVNIVNPMSLRAECFFNK